MRDHHQPVERLLERAERELKPRRRFPRSLIILAVIAVVGVSGVVIYFSLPLEAPIPDDVGQLYSGLERGYTEQGFPRLGSADAPVLVEDFSSFACPHCRDFHVERLPNLVDEIAAGQVQFVFIPIASIGSGAEHAAQAAFCAGEQGRFWEMSDVLFDWQKRFIASTFNPRRIRKGAENLGLDTAAFAACFDGDRLPVIDVASAEFKRRGLSGTPSFFINGERVRDYQELDALSEMAD